MADYQTFGRRAYTSAFLELSLAGAVVVVTLLVAAALVWAAGVQPGVAGRAFFDGAFGTRLNLAGTLSKVVPLTLVALAWIVAFRAGRIHVGFPGQILVGGLFVSVVALKVGLPSGLHLAACVLAGIVGGAFYAGIAAYLWARRGVNEILSTLLLNLVAAQLLAWWVRHPMHDASTPLAITPPFPDSSRWATLLKDTTLHWDIVLVPIAVVVVSVLLRRSLIGFKIRVVGANARLAAHAGFKAATIGTIALLISGALAGLAGSSLVLAGNVSAMTEDFGASIGFTGIAVALLARNSPAGVIPAALLFAALQQGGGVMEGTVGLSAALVEFLQGVVIILILLATTFFAAARRRGRAKASIVVTGATHVEPETEQVRAASAAREEAF